MPVIQYDSPLLAGLGAAAQYGQQGFQNNALMQQLALAKLKQEQDNAIAQGQLANQTALVQPQIAHMGAETGLIGAQTSGQNIQNQYTPQVLQSTIGKNNAETGLIGAQTTGQNLTNRTIVPNANAENLLKGAMTNLYGTQALHNQAETTQLIPAQVQQMNTAAAHEAAMTGLTNQQVALMQKMGVVSKNGQVNAANAWQIINTDPYLKSVVPQWMGQDPQMVAGSPAFQSLDPAHQAAVMAILNEPGVRRNVATPQDLQKNATKIAGSTIATMYEENSPNPLNSPYAKLVANPGGGMALLKLNAAITQMIQKVGQQPNPDQIRQVLQAAAAGHPQYGIDAATAQMLLAPLGP